MYILREDNRIRIAAVLGGVAIIAITLVYMLHGLIGSTTLTAITDSSSVIFAATCAILCGILWHHFRKGEVLKKVWGFLWIGLILWTAAEIVYAVYELFILKDTPYPSLADAFFVPGFIPLFLALYYRYSSLRISPPRNWVIASGVAYIIVLLLWLIFLIIPMMQTPEPGAELEQALNIVYPIGDLLVVFGAMLTMLALVGGDLSLPWGAIALGCLLLAFSDSLYAYGTWNEIYLPDKMNLVTALTDVTYVAGYIVMAFGLYVQARLQRIL